ncbi:MAG: hypothetical protein L0312_03275, partial [Acidobacteria bacterium]|nr:hypothetical protein [Acidobacteriota bacterium]
AFALLAEGPLHEIRRIQSEIEVYTGADIAQQEQAPLWLRLAGRRARWGETPASVLTAFLDALRKGVQTIAAYNATGRVAGRPPLDLQRACDVELVAFQPGSLRVGMRLPEPEQLEIFAQGYWPRAHEALKEFLVVADWASSASSLEELATRFHDISKRRVVLRSLKPFVPRPQGGIDYLELSGAALPERRTIRLSQEAVQRISDAFETAISEREERFEGEIREMDLDRQTFRLRNVPVVNEVPCRYGDDLAPTASVLLGKRVRVIGIRAVSADTAVGFLEVVDLERVQERTSEHNDLG